AVRMVMPARRSTHRDQTPAAMQLGTSRRGRNRFQSRVFSAQSKRRSWHQRHEDSEQRTYHVRSSPGLHCQRDRSRSSDWSTAQRRERLLLLAYHAISAAVLYDDPSPRCRPGFARCTSRWPRLGADRRLQYLDMVIQRESTSSVHGGGARVSWRARWIVGAG